MKTQDSEPLELTGKQGAVLALLVSGATIEGAAKSQDINPSSVHAWLKKPEFRGAYNDALSDVISHASAQLKAACSVAVATLREVAEDTGAPSAPRVSAARAILELASKQIEQEEILARIEALEGLTP
jgi:transposase-like protein